MESRVLRVFLILVLIVVVHSDGMHRRKKQSGPIKPSVINVMESSESFWNNKARNFIKSSLNTKLNTKKAKNLIFFVGDGMSISTVAATRMHLGNEEDALSFEAFPHFGFAKTFCADRQVSDSACTAVSLLSGLKTNFEVLGLTSNVSINECDYSEADYVETIASWAQKAKMATGYVTTTKVTHATPAALFSHVPNRLWEDDHWIPDRCKNKVKDITHQLVHGEVGKNFKVILGGGRKHFMNRMQLDQEGRPGLRTDGRDLIDEWLTERNNQTTSEGIWMRTQKAKAEFVWHKQQLEEIDVESTDYLLGLFENDHCMYNIDIMNNNLQNQEPTLTDMTVKAIKMLQKDKNGFFLFVEGGRIDHAHHDNFAYKALDETKEFARAIEFAKKMTNADETLIVVTADHSHTLTYGGYAPRGSNIKGIAEISEADNLPYEVLSYATGPGHSTTYNNKKTGRADFMYRDFKNPQRRSSATSPLNYATHAGEDVGVYASGPWSHLFTGTYEQGNIPGMMAYAAKFGQFSVSSTGNLQSLPSFLIIASSMLLISLTRAYMHSF